MQTCPRSRGEDGLAKQVVENGQEITSRVAHAREHPSSIPQSVSTITRHVHRATFHHTATHRALYPESPRLEAAVSVSIEGAFRDSGLPQLLVLFCQLMSGPLSCETRLS